MKTAETYIGTSGWQYRHWRGTFYPADVKVKDHFSYYKLKFRTVELNNPFYRLPTKETFRKWRDAVPDGFVYAVKASRLITHLKKLKEPEMTLKDFMANVSELEEKLGPILFQLPPGWGFNEERLRAFLKALPKHYRYVMEFRNPTWYNETVNELLREYNIAFCLYELAGHNSPETVTADFVYIRLHGPGDKYQGSYKDKTLHEWAERCRKWMQEKKDVFIYFDNDQLGYAAHNAMRLEEMLGED